jgi:FO synthase
VNLQAPPNLTPEGYPIYLRAGINDWGGVSPLTPDFINPEAPWPALVELERRTRDAGYVLRARLPIYPEFITDEFVAAALRPHIEDLAGADGLVNETIERRMLPRGVLQDVPR